MKTFTHSNIKSTESEVLFQKLGSSWYIFTEIGGEMVFSALPKGVDPHSTKVELYAAIESHLKQVSKVEKRRRTNQSAAA